MTATRVALSIVSWVWATTALAEDLSPGDLAKRVVHAYASLDTYQAEGTVYSDINHGHGNMKTETTFSMYLKKPDQYLISWTKKMPMGMGTNVGTVWNDGQQACVYTGFDSALRNEGTCTRMSEASMAIAYATGISGGAAYRVPSLFLALNNVRLGWPARLKNPSVASGVFEEEACYILQGVNSGEKETYWISKSTYLIRKYERSIGGSTYQHDTTDEEIDERIRMLGFEPTPQNRASMRKKMQDSVNAASIIGGTKTEIHRKISHPKVEEKDVRFVLPEGTVIEDYVPKSQAGERQRSGARPGQS